MTIRIHFVGGYYVDLQTQFRDVQEATRKIVDNQCDGFWYSDSGVSVRVLSISYIEAK